MSNGRIFRNGGSWNGWRDSWPNGQCFLYADRKYALSGTANAGMACVAGLPGFVKITQGSWFCPSLQTDSMDFTWLAEFTFVLFSSRLTTCFNPKSGCRSSSLMMASRYTSASCSVPSGSEIIVLNPHSRAFPLTWNATFVSMILPGTAALLCSDLPGAGPRSGSVICRLHVPRCGSDTISTT